MEDKISGKHFASIHKRIQTKYGEMQRRLEKSKSVDTICSLDDDFVYKDNRYGSNSDLSSNNSISTIGSLQDQILLRRSLLKSVIVEENRDLPIQYSSVEQLSVSKSEVISNDANENDDDEIERDFFIWDDPKISLESLNEETQDNDYLGSLPPTPSTSPQKSRFKFGSRITAAREKRRLEKEKNKKKESNSKVDKFVLSNTLKHEKPFKKTKVATVNIALIEATGLESDASDEKPRLLFCRFRLGGEKYKSKSVKSSTSQAKWQELFSFPLIDDQDVEISLWDKDLLIGRSFIDLSEIEKEKTHKMRINLDVENNENNVQLFILLTITGISMMNTVLDLYDYKETQKQLALEKKKFAWYQFKGSGQHLGKLSVIVYGAKGLAEKDCYCILQINNDRLQTDTENKTNDPNWMKIFNFDVTDVTSILNITIHDEKKSEDVGRLNIPLLNIKSGEKKWYALKDPTLRERARGNNPRILLEMKLSWNLVKASIRVINPKEQLLLQSVDKVDRHIFARNLARAKIVLNGTLHFFAVIKTFLEWESKQQNAIAFVLWLLFCWFFRIWMVPLLLLIPFVRYRNPQNLFNKTPEVTDVDVKKEEDEKRSIRQRLLGLQEMVQTVQNFIGAFANLGESIKNLFNFTVPYLSYLAIFLVVTIATVMYLIPTKYIFIIWGVHKFTRKMLRPNRVPNNEILDLLSRVPNDEVLLDCKEIPLEEIPEEDVIR